MMLVVAKSQQRPEELWEVIGPVENEMLVLKIWGVCIALDRFLSASASSVCDKIVRESASFGS